MSWTTFICGNNKWFREVIWVLRPKFLIHHQTEDNLVRHARGCCPTFSVTSIFVIVAFYSCYCLSLSVQLKSWWHLLCFNLVHIGPIHQINLAYLINHWNGSFYEPLKFCHLTKNWAAIPVLEKVIIFSRTLPQKL